ncbi:MAG: threonine dehydrogenase-like Zn-dependent dehydrogenase/predicted dehydrogenase [Planctomycetota bacterium]|jgi:threonine dehydrogenase-like Zn-dependent dehydrogenase/predicted dehydrogenase
MRSFECALLRRNSWFRAKVEGSGVWPNGARAVQIRGKVYSDSDETLRVGTPELLRSFGSLHPDQATAMKAVLQNPKTGKLLVSEVPPPILQPEGVLVRVTRSLITLGTERSVIAVSQHEQGVAPKQPTSLMRRILGAEGEQPAWSRYQVVKNLAPAPIPLGYSCSGIVVKLGSEVDELSVGDRVGCYGLHFASHAELNYIPRNLAVKVPDEVSNNAAAFIALGASAMQAVRLAELELGERVVVIGAGLTGQLVAQLARANGANVLITDGSSQRCQLARELGAHAAVDDPKALEQAVARFTNGHGADAVILCDSTPSSELLRVAADCARVKARVVLVGDAGVGIERRPIADKAIKLIVSHGFGAGRLDTDYEIHGRDYPLPLVRWTERRNGEAFLEMLARGTIEIDPLISEHFPIDQAEEAYRSVMGSRRNSSIAVVLDYGPASESEKFAATVRLGNKPVERAKPDQVNLGTIGAGNFAKGVLLPAFDSILGVRMRAFCTSSGSTSKAIAERYGASFCTSDPAEVLLSDEVNTLLITTRHDQHAPLALIALKAGKAVYIHRPLCIRTEELIDFVKLGQKSTPALMVGYGRRFAPLAAHCRDFFRDVTEPLHVSYRINAAALPVESWVHDPTLGGGRILSEVSQFVDMLCFLTDSLPARIHADPINVPSSPKPNRDSLTITIRMQNDSLAVIHFLTNGDSVETSERIEISGGGQNAVLDNFRKLTLHQNGRRKVKKTSRPQKGFREEVEAFVSSVRNGTDMPTPYETLIAVSRTGFLINKSLEQGEAVDYSAPAMPRPIF